MATPQSGIDLRDVVRLFNQTTRLATSASGAEECLARALELVCDFLGCPVGHVYLVNPRLATLRPTDIWHASDAERASPFVEATSRTPLPSGRGAGRPRPGDRADAVERGMGEDPRGAAAIASGMGAGIAAPIVGGQGIEGVMELFPQGRRPEELPPRLILHVGLDLVGAVLGARRTRDRGR